MRPEVSGELLSKPYCRMRRGLHGHTCWNALILGLLTASILTGCGGRLEPASLQMVNDAKARWLANPVLSYRIVAEVEGQGERRRNEITVSQGQITGAIVMYWNSDQRRWDDPLKLREEQAYPFTAPGLFDLVRDELLGSGRRDIRIVMSGDPAFPRRIVLGPIWQDEQPRSGTETRVTIRSFVPVVADEIGR